MTHDRCVIELIDPVGQLERENKDHGDAGLWACVVNYLAPIRGRNDGEKSTGWPTLTNK